MHHCRQADLLQLPSEAHPQYHLEPLLPQVLCLPSVSPFSLAPLHSQVFIYAIPSQLFRILRDSRVRPLSYGLSILSCVIVKSWWLKDYPRWVFRKNLIEFFIGLSTYLYYFYKWLYTISLWLHVLLECSMITCPCHVIWLP